MARRPADKNAETLSDKVRVHAADWRVFTNADLKDRFGPDNGPRAQAAALGLVGTGALVRHAIGIYSLPGISSTDSRVVDAIERTGAKEVRPEVAEAHARRIEERNAKLTRTKAVGRALVDQVRDHFKTHDVAMRSELNTRIGPGAWAAADALLRDGTLKRIEDGLYAKQHVDVFGPELADYIRRNSVELATIKREIEHDIANLPESTGRDSISYEHWIPTPREGDTFKRPSRVYVNIPGLPAIYAIKSRKKGGTGITWFGAKDTTIGSLAAEHIANMVFETMPESYAELIGMVARNEAPRQTRRRSGGYSTSHRAPATSEGDWNGDDGRWEPDRSGGSTPSRREEREPVISNGYTTYDTDRLDPCKLGTPLPEEVVLRFDARETDYMHTRLIDVPNLTIVRTQMALGDFRASHDGREIIFERKTTADLVASLLDGRLTSQVRRLSEHGAPVVFLIEGGMFNSRALPLAKLATVQSRLSLGMNMRIMETIDQAHTAYALVIAIRDHFFGTGSKFDLTPVRLPKASPIEIAKAMIEMTPGISPTRSSALLRRFGSIGGIASATVKEIASVDGMGPTTAARLHDVLNAGALLNIDNT